MDNRQKELLVRAKNDMAMKMMNRINRHYTDMKRQPDLQAIIKIPSIMLYFQNRAFVREFLQMEKQAKIDKGTETIGALDAQYQGYSELMDVMDSALKEINPSSNPIDEMFLICSILRMGINTLVTNPPTINTGG
jgi:hypothetical protein